jgi:hypothetical protein
VGKRWSCKWSGRVNWNSPSGLGIVILVRPKPAVETRIENVAFVDHVLGWLEGGCCTQYPSAAKTESLTMPLSSQALHNGCLQLSAA